MAYHLSSMLYFSHTTGLSIPNTPLPVTAAWWSFGILLPSPLTELTPVLLSSPGIKHHFFQEVLPEPLTTRPQSEVRTPLHPHSTCHCLLEFACGYLISNFYHTHPDIILKFWEVSTKFCSSCSPMHSRVSTEQGSTIFTN